MLEADSSYIAGCKLVNCGQVSSAAAIEMVGAYLTAESNQILDDGVGHGLRIGTSGLDTHHALAFGNEIVGAGYDGIYMDDAVECLVMGNIIKDSLDDGIDLQSGADGNTFDGNLISGVADQGLEVSSDQSTMFKNRVKKSGGHGVRIYGTSTDSFWFKNKVKKSGASGFYVTGPDNAFTKNVAKGSTDVDLLDNAGVNANDYVDNTFGTTSN